MGGVSLESEAAVPWGDSHYLAVSLCPKISHLLCQENRACKPKLNRVRVPELSLLMYTIR